MPTNAAHRDYLEKIQILIDRFPIVFDRSNPLPLEIGVFEKIIELPNLGMCDDELEHVLLCWTSRREYCRSMELLRWRYDLIGQRVEAISPADLENNRRRYESFVRRGML